MDIKDSALRYLGPRARTCREMKEHLQAKGFSQQEIEEVIRELSQLHYLDDQDYCRPYFDYAFGKGKGASRVKRELEQKGVDRATIEIAFEEYESEETEMERAKKQAAKIAAGKQIDEKLMAKMGRRLTGLGYRSDVVYQIIGSYMEQHDE